MPPLARTLPEHTALKARASRCVRSARRRKNPLSFSRRSHPTPAHARPHTPHTRHTPLGRDERSRGASAGSRETRRPQ
eukprot:4113966-Prymnesium_polylepis.1